MRKAWPTYETSKNSRVQRAILRGGIRAAHYYSTTTTTTNSLRVKWHNTLVRTLFSAAHGSTQSRLRPNVPIPQRYISDEELHRRIRELKEDEARQARRKAFQLAISNALAQTNTTVRAFQLATAQALITQEDDIKDAPDQEDPSSTRASDLIMASQVGDEEAFIAAVDTALEQSLAGRKISNMKPRQIPPIYVRATTPSTEDLHHAQLDEEEALRAAADTRHEQDLSRTNESITKTRKKPPVYVRATTPSTKERTSDLPRAIRRGRKRKTTSHANDAVRRRNAHIRQLAGLPPVEDENLMEMDSYEETEPDDATPARYEAKDVYDMISPKWNALLERYNIIRQESRLVCKMLSELERYYHFHFKRSQGFNWRAMYLPYEQSNRSIERAAHLLRFELRSRLVHDLFYGSAKILESWCHVIQQRIADMSSEMVEVTRLYSSFKFAVSHPKRSEVDRKITLLQHQVAMLRKLFSEDRVGVRWLSYVQHLLRGDSPLSLLEKEYFLKSNAIVTYRSDAHWVITTNIYGLRRASEAVHHVLRMRYGAATNWPYKERLYSILRNRVHLKASNVGAAMREISAQLNLTSLAMFTRSKVEFENGLLQERESKINESFSKFVADLRQELRARKNKFVESIRSQADPFDTSSLSDGRIGTAQHVRQKGRFDGLVWTIQS